MSTPVALHRRPWGVELELADGSLWRPTRDGLYLVRFPTALNHAEARALLAERGPLEAAAHAEPPPPIWRVAPRPTIICTACGREGTPHPEQPTRCKACALGGDIARASWPTPGLRQAAD